MAKFDEQNTKFNQKFDEKFDEQNKRFDEQNRRLEEQNRRLKEQNRRLKEQNEEIASRLEKMENSQDAMKQRITEISEQCEAKMETLSKIIDIAVEKVEKTREQSESVLRKEINVLKEQIANLQTNGIPSGAKLKTPLLDVSKHEREISRLELAIRCQKPKETIREYANEINRLANLTYVGDLPEEIIERLKINAFITGLRDVEIKKAVWTAPRTTFYETLGLALIQEKLCNSNVKIQQTEVAESNDISDVVYEAIRKVMQEDQQLQNSTIRRCYNCQKPGHFARECRSRRTKTRPASPTRDSSDSTNTKCKK
uniref:CCHC-type domain-containing protein n=1 Tax=Glossina brevipalpis TaxID=37001 RepID=A0A1A9WGL5_9MUSC